MANEELRDSVANAVEPPPLRLALVSTPRSGNTWLRMMLGQAFALEELAVDDPSQVDWGNLPRRFILQVHWLPTDEFARKLSVAGVKVVTIARHPLAVLLSILHFTTRNPRSSWLHGEGGSEAPLHGLRPTDPEFLEYACGPRFRALLSVSSQWWRRDGVHRVRYEDLVADPVAGLAALSASLGAAPVRPLADVVEQHSLDAMHRKSRDEHIWMGRPDLWRSFLTRDAAANIVQEQKEVFDALGYDVEADPALSPFQAQINWLAVESYTAGKDIRLLKELYESVGQSLIREARNWSELFAARQAGEHRQDAQLVELHQSIRRLEEQLVCIHGETANLHRGFARLSLVPSHVLELRDKLVAVESRLQKVKDRQEEWIERLSHVERQLEAYGRLGPRTHAISYALRRRLRPFPRLRAATWRMIERIRSFRRAA